MFTIGLTGQSGAGKGEFSRIFLEKVKAVCLDTDITARQVVEKGKPCLDELSGYFGNEILDENGNLDRKKLASIAFSDKEKHQKLNTITHFHIMKEICAWLSDTAEGGAKVAIIDAPLLFESGADKLCDITVGIIAPYSTRLQRVMKRDGIDEKNAKIRIDSQPDDSFFKDKCTYIICNDNDIDSLRKNILNLIDTITKKHLTSPKGKNTPV